MRHVFIQLFLLTSGVGCLFPTQAQHISPLSSPVPTRPVPTQLIPTGAARQSAPMVPGAIRYVKAGASGTGVTWSNASGDLQAMINASASGDQVWIAGGTYKPSTGGLSNARTAAFSLKNGVRVLGGFTGVNGTEGINSTTTRTALPSSTTLSGDIGKAGDASDNTYHVVFNNNNGLDNSAVLDGVAIRGGNANSPSTNSLDSFGGGIFNYGSSPSILNCQISQNYADAGGGMVNAYATTTRIINCSFRNNTSNFAGGIYETTTTNTTIVNCVFDQNSSGLSGGLRAVAATNVTLTNCTFRTNTVDAIGTQSNSTLNLLNCLLWNNSGETVIQGAGVKVSYSLLKAGAGNYTDGGHNQTLTSSPFINATGPQLLPCSPAIDAGNDGANSTTTDVLGAHRKFGTIDIGATEYQGSPYTVLVTVQAMPNSICVGSATSLQATVRGPLTGPYSYTWTAPAGATLTSTSQNPTSATATAAGTLNFSIRVSDAVGCQATSTISVTAGARPNAAFLGLNGPYCTNTAALTLTPATSGGTFAGPGVSGNTFTPANAGNGGSITYRVTGSNSCTNSSSQTVLVNPAPMASLSNDGPITCAKTSVNLLASSSPQSVTYTFSGQGVIVSNGNTARVNQEGVYTVKVTSANGCSATRTTLVQSSTTAPSATLSTNGPLTVNQLTATLTAGGGGTYTFSAGATQQTGGATATVSSPGTYQVTVTNSGNGCTATASTLVTGSTSQSSCRNGSGVITVVASGIPVKYEWYRNGINPTRLPEDPTQSRGTISASLTLVNQQVTADYYVRVTDQNGSVVEYGLFRFTVNLNCNIYARQGAEEVELRISLLGNPIQDDQLRATISGAEGKVLNVQLLDLSGRPIRAQQWQQAEAEHSVEWSISGQASGVYMLQATTPDQRHSVKVIKQ